MTATLLDIEYWLTIAKQKDASHLIVAVDTFEHDNYPVYVGQNEDVRKEIERIESQSMQRIDEVYNMSMNIEEQLSKQRVFNL